MTDRDSGAEYVIKPLSDLYETVGGYKFINATHFYPQCVKCWNMLRVDYDKSTQTARIYKCDQAHDEE